MIPSNKVLSIIIVVAISTVLLSSSMVSGLIKTASIKIGILHLDNAHLIQEVLAKKHTTKTTSNQTTSTQEKAGGHAISRVYSPTGGCVPGGTKCVPCDPGLARYGANCVWSTDWHPSSTILSQGNPVKTASGPLPKTLPLPTAANGKVLNKKALAKAKIALQGLETKGLIPLNTTKIFSSVLEGKASKSDRAALAFRICDSKLLFSKLKSKCDKLKSFNQPTPTKGTIHPHNPIIGIVEACEANSACSAIVEDIVDWLQDLDLNEINPCGYGVICP